MDKIYDRRLLAKAEKKIKVPAADYISDGFTKHNTIRQSLDYYTKIFFGIHGNMAVRPFSHSIVDDILRLPRIPQL